MTNREIAQEISNRIGTAPVPFDSVYSIALEIYHQLGGEESQFDSVYSILLEILPLVEGGGSGKAIEEVDALPEASENKDKFYRLSSDDNVYVSELIGTSEVNAPDSEQVDNAYMIGTFTEFAPDTWLYKGATTGYFSDGEMTLYYWECNHDEGYKSETMFTKMPASEITSISTTQGALGTDIELYWDDNESKFISEYTIDETNQMFSERSLIDDYAITELYIVKSSVETWAWKQLDNSIVDVDTLPDASLNKNKLFRLDNGDKDVYAAKLLSSETITTNRLPDEQQIDKAYLYNTYSSSAMYYKGIPWKIICTNGEISLYCWGDNFDYELVYFSYDNAENINSSSKLLWCANMDGIEIDEDAKTISVSLTIEDMKSYFYVLDEEIKLIPAIYNAPESAQIGNAYISTDDGFQCVYTGEETTIEVDGESINVYKWYNDDEWFELYSTKRASEIYYADANSESEPIISDTIFYSSDGIPSGAYNAYIPQLNASDSEQVDNAYVDVNDGGGGFERFYYTGIRKTLVVSDGSLYAYIWGENTSTSEYYDWSYATTVPANEIYGNEKVTLSALDDYGWTVSGDTLTNLEISLNDLEENNIIPIGSDGDTVSTVKYQRTKTTEEWGWEKVATEQYVDDAIADIPQLESGENIAIEDNKISAKGYKYIDNIQAFIENPYSYQRNISEYPLSMLGITELKLTGSANTLTYTYSGSGSTAFEQMAGMIITNMGGGLKIESGNYAYLETIDTTNKTVTFKSTLDADNALSNAIVTAIVIKTDFFISGGSGDTTYSYTDTLDVASSIEYFIDSNLYMKFEGYPLVKVTAIDTENETITFNKTLNAESAISNVNFEYGRYDANVASGFNSHVEGAGNECSGNFTHAEGHSTNAVGENSHAEGSSTTASGGNSHAEGASTTASGDDSHAEGISTVAEGNYSHTEGYKSQTTGKTTAFAAHAEGSNTIAQNYAEHAEGTCNVSHQNSTQADDGLNTIHSIGIGKTNARKNAIEVLRNGDMYVFGVGGYQGTNTKVQDAAINTLQEYIASLEARIYALEHPNS